MTFLAKPLRLDREDMVKYILAIPKNGFKRNPNTGALWAPRGIVWHNTGIPDLQTWSRYSTAQKASWGENYDLYCKTLQRWHSGPHGMGTPDDLAFVLCDLQADGVHDSCRNRDYFGWETVGNFARGADDPLSGSGLASMESSANAIAALCARFDFDPLNAIEFHRDCARDGHPCPGALVTDAWAIGMVEKRLAEIKAAAADVATRSTTPAVTAPALTPNVAVVLPIWPTDPHHPFFVAAAKLYNQWLTLGVSIPFALAMVTQAEFESAFEPNVVGDHGTAFSIYQWHWSPRGEQILNATEIDIRHQADMAKIVAAAWWELNHTEIAAREAIAKSTTAREAAIEACVLFEKAGAAEAAERRGLGAERWSVWAATNAEFIAANA